MLVSVARLRRVACAAIAAIAVASVLALSLGGAAFAAPEDTSTQRPSAEASGASTAIGGRDAAATEREGMPTVPVVVFGLLMALGIGAVAVLVKRLDIRGARRATAALTADTALEDELQAMIADSAQTTPRTR